MLHHWFLARGHRVFFLLAGLCLLSVQVDALDLSNEPIQPIKAPVNLDGKKVDVGRRLFNDTIMSSDGDISCASCHNINSGGTDGQQFSIGTKGRIGTINTPTVFNSSKLFRQFWDGRVETLHDQVDDPVTNPIEMNAKWPNILARMFDDSYYSKVIPELYSDGITRDNVKDLLVEYQKSLVSVDSSFDLYLQGDESAVTENVKKGYELFKSYGCSSCHQGENVGGNMFQIFGVINSYFKQRGNITDADLGRYNITGNKNDRHMFKVPSLRMAKHTAPYLHDGTQKTLRDAVDVMFKYQLGREAPDKDKQYIVEFIESLAGQHPEIKK